MSWIPPPEAAPPKGKTESETMYRQRLKTGDWCTCDKCCACQPWRVLYRDWRAAKAQGLFKNVGGR